MFINVSLIRARVTEAAAESACVEGSGGAAEQVEGRCRADQRL